MFSHENCLRIGLFHGVPHHGEISCQICCGCALPTFGMLMGGVVAGILEAEFIKVDSINARLADQPFAGLGNERRPFIAFEKAHI